MNTCTLHTHPKVHFVRIKVSNYLLDTGPLKKYLEKFKKIFKNNSTNN